IDTVIGVEAVATGGVSCGAVPRVDVAAASDGPGAPADDGSPDAGAYVGVNARRLSSFSTFSAPFGVHAPRTSRPTTTTRLPRNEVLGLGVMQDDRRRGLLRLVLVARLFRALE